jgi:hypothetical protein
VELASAAGDGGRLGPRVPLAVAVAVAAALAAEASAELDPAAPQPPTASSGTGAKARNTVRRDHPAERGASGAITL